ncbi:hypothetical protein, partial [Limnohabitans sp. Rim28]|uniref:hypothetical protein n=1 Tax=Limnohabitans sp. Rim28 TaxID=1100720 RepID=UPI0003648582
GVDAGAETSLLGSVIDNKADTDVDTVAKLQALATAVQAVMDGNATKTQLELLGITGVTTDNLAAVQANLAAANDATQLKTLLQLQWVVSVGAANAANTALGTAQSELDAAQLALSTALSAMSDPATLAQLLAVETAQTALTAKATAATAAANAANTAVTAATDAATAAGEAI